MCYRDRTYCEAPCAAEGCSRKLTPEVERSASRVGLPIALSDLRVGCTKYLPLADALGAGAKG
jgi:hypothetical protein